MPASQTAYAQPFRTVTATSYGEPAYCERYSDDGYVYFVDCQYGIAYSTASVGFNSKSAGYYDTVPETSSSTTSLYAMATGITGYDEPVSIWNATLGSWVPVLGNMTTASSSAVSPLVITTEGGVWIAGSYAGASFVGSASVFESVSLSASSSAAYKKSGKPSSLPIILSCVFGALALGFGAALFVLLHRRRRARKSGLSNSPRMSMAGGGRSAYATLPSPTGHSGSPAGPFTNDRRISLLGSGGFSVFAPEEVDPLTGTTLASSGTGTGAGLERSMTTGEKQALLREASLAERRAAAGTLEDDELAIVRQKLDTWASLARETRRPGWAQQRPIPVPASVEDANSPFADSNAVVPGLQPPAGVRLPLTITTALPSPRSAPQTTVAGHPHADGGESVFSYSHTPLSLYPGESPAGGPSSDGDDHIRSPEDGTMAAPLLAPSPLSPDDSPSNPEAATTVASLGQPLASDAGRSGETGVARQEVDAGHLAGLRRYTLNDDGFPAGNDDDEVQPPAYRW